MALGPSRLCFAMANGTCTSPFMVTSFCLVADNPGAKGTSEQGLGLAAGTLERHRPHRMD